MNSLDEISMVMDMSMALSFDCFTLPSNVTLLPIDTCRVCLPTTFNRFFRPDLARGSPLLLS